MKEVAEKHLYVPLPHSRGSVIVAHLTNHDSEPRTSVSSFGVFLPAP